MIEIVILLASVATTEAITQKRGNGGAYQAMLDNSIRIREQVIETLEQTKKISVDMDISNIKESNA